MSRLGKKINNIRGNLTYAEFAKDIKEKTNMSFHPTTLQKYVSGVREPSQKILQILAEYAGQPLSFFFDEEASHKRDPRKPMSMLKSIQKSMSEMLAVSYIPVVGNLATNTHFLTDDNIKEYIPFPQEFIKEAKNAFVIKVTDSSMINAGIASGDFAIIQQQSSAMDGQIVVARINGEIVLRRIFRDGKQFRMEPANINFPIISTRNPEILGTVIMSIRHH